MALQTTSKEYSEPIAAQSDEMPDPALAKQAVELTAQLLEAAKREQTAGEKQQAAKLAKMMDDPVGKTMTLQLTDQAFRSNRPARIADQIKFLLGRYGAPLYFQGWERMGLKVGSWVGQIAPQLFVPFVVAKVRQDTRSVILPREEDKLRSYLQKRQADGMRLNINQLGEAILGEEEAGRRFEAYLKLLRRPDVEYISVKISSIFSQINMIAFEETLETIKIRLRELYRTAMQHHFVGPDGQTVPKFVNLDMEEYRDLHLTVAAFQQVLDEPEFTGYKAGIVLQAYLPDSAPVQRALTQWAIERVAKGGAPIKIRLVKGANLAMEKVEAAWHGWEQAPYRTKDEVDANFKKMVTYGLHPERAPAVLIGIASHNLFDVAYALLLRDKYGLHEYVDFEMLEGMANHQARAVQAQANGLLLYAPVVRKEDFHSAISYLVRRLDENTDEENFLHDLFGLEVGSPAWNDQRDRFVTAFNHQHDVGEQPQRTQNRQTEQISMAPNAPFQNEPDTDWSLPQNQAWIKAIRDRWQSRDVEPIPLQIGGQLIEDDFKGEGHNPGRPQEVAYRYALANPAQIDQALDTAKAAQPGWANKSTAERKALLVRCAENLARHRGDLIGAMMLDGGKLVPEADGEVSEAIDFANYYARSLDIASTELAGYQFEPLGMVLVTPPWNFPLAIPCGGVLAALMAGNSVILKPAPEAVLVGWELANVLWETGIPKEVLQFVPTTDDKVGRALVTDARVNGVILTGAYDTGRLFQSWKPELKLMAETSGKNSLIITGMADHDQAIKDLVKSAFGHAGQKCSAASLAILEAEVYDNPTFLRQLRDAASSLKVGAPWDLGSKVSPVIREPSQELARALTTLEKGESWLLEPKMIDGNPNLWSPGIKLGVKPGSFFHKTECFGPVLGLIRAENLDEAIAIANDSDFGLTGGIHSLDEREIEQWREQVQVGNAYINRSITGAIVQRQPFGGWKNSAFGYAKAGGPNYVLSLGTWQARTPQDKAALLEAGKRSYQQAWAEHFSVEHDPSRVLGESNIFRYRPIEHLILRVEDDGDFAQAQLVLLAAQRCGVPVTVSLGQNVTNSAKLKSADRVTMIIEDEAGLIYRLKQSKWSRLRALRPVSNAVREAANEMHIAIVEEPVLANGRLELRHYLREQAISRTVHRYGNLI